MPRVGLLLHVLESKLIFLTIAALIGKRMPARWLRWLSTAALQGVILGCLLTVFSYAMLPAWETCLVWLATRLSLRVASMLAVFVVWQFGVMVLGKWAWNCVAGWAVVCLGVVGINVRWTEKGRRAKKVGVKTGTKARKARSGEGGEARKSKKQAGGASTSEVSQTSGSEDDGAVRFSFEEGVYQHGSAGQLRWRKAKMD